MATTAERRKKKRHTVKNVRMSKEKTEPTIIHQRVQQGESLKGTTNTSHTNGSVSFQHGEKRRDAAGPSKRRKVGKDVLVGTNSAFGGACPEVDDGITFTRVDGMTKSKNRRQQSRGSSTSTSSVLCPSSAMIQMEKEEAVPTVTHERNSQGDDKSRKKKKKKKTKQKNYSRQLDPADPPLTTAVRDRAQRPADLSAGHRAPRASPTNENPATTSEPTATRKRKRESEDKEPTIASPLDFKSRTLHGSSGRPSETAGTAGRRAKKTAAAVIGADGRAVKTPAAGGTSAGAAPRLSQLQQRMRQKLEGAQFRMINETLYTSESKAALARFTREPELFDVYHRGFREQVGKWPMHPLDLIIRWLGKYPEARVADFGCGEARLAASVPNKVYSFDLVSPNSRVTACDMAHVPLKDASVHVAVFCLSLMGTNLADFLREAHRVLVPGGLVKVAEVRSRFEGEEGGVERFLEVTNRLGFDRRQIDCSNKMFLMAEFKKSGRRPENGVEFEAKACIYKRR